MITPTNDLTNADNLAQARFELGRAVSHSMLAAWATKWGEAACEALENLPDPWEIEDLKREVKAADTEVDNAAMEVNDLENELRVLQEAADRAVEALRPLIPFHKSIAEIADALEAA